MLNRNQFFNAQSQATGFINPMENSYLASQNYYAGNMIPNINKDNMYQDEIESRISKIERQINRLNERINKLESTTFYSNTDDTNNSMYMI